jgi:hypothetical protein
MFGMKVPVTPMRRFEHYFTAGSPIERLPYVKDVARLALCGGRYFVSECSLLRVVANIVGLTAPQHRHSRHPATSSFPRKRESIGF